VGKSIPPAPTTTVKLSPGVVGMALEYESAPPPPAYAPAPTATAEIDVYPAGTTKVYVPGDVYCTVPKGSAAVVP
jgi:hypothetical protein